MEGSDKLRKLLAAIAKDTGFDPEAVLLSRDPAGSDMIAARRGVTLASLGFEDGQLLFLQGEVSTPSASKSEEKSASEEPARPRCRHGPRGSCLHCIGDSKSEESDAMAGAWRCHHRPDQMCLNCGGAAKGEKVELAMLCRHGPDARCTNCMPDDEVVEKRKHVTFEEFLAKRRERCEHSFSAVCINCMPPAEIRYTVKMDCRKHRPWPAGLCNECQPPAATLQRQKYRHLDYVEFLNFNAFNRFAALWTGCGMVKQRAGILYGHYQPDPNYPLGVKAVVEAIYEPPQEGTVERVTLLADPHARYVERVAAACGLEPVGWIFTHLPRDYMLGSDELRQMARLQLAHKKATDRGARFVTMVLTQNELGEIAPRAFMASDQCMALERDGVLGDSDDPRFCVRRQPGKAEVLPDILRASAKEGTRSMERFEPDFFIVEVNSGRPKVVPGIPVPTPVFAHSDFPVENRGEFGELQNKGMLVAYLRKYASEPLPARLSDFHLLVYLPLFFDIDTAVAVASAIARGSTLDDGLKFMLESLLAS
eukprot:PLAT15538.9.p1 GENE.PLAT15538.9~~PLAT15538.9.p1  ORF type:complete len:566 (+),score=210.95 PLAT15538.9:88-1698(+)